MMHAVSRAIQPHVRPLRLFATLWSLRQYPTRSREWSWERKFSAIRAAGCDGVFSPPRPELVDRGGLAYPGVVSLDHPRKVARALQAVKEFGAEAIDVQLGDYDSSLADMLKLTDRLQAGALMAHLHRTSSPAPVRAVPELGHAAPAYGLSCFGDTWRDAQALVRDLRRLWRETAAVT